MVIFGITKTQDSDNSYIDDSDHVAITDNGEEVTFQLMHPERSFSVRKSDIIQVLKSMEDKP